MTTKEIVDKYPELFGEPPFDIKETLIPFGFEVSKYWKPILEKGFGKIAEVVKEQGITDYRIVQVKEKFGGLRIYSRGYYDVIDPIIEEMEEECEHTCEKCGSPEGILRTEGWMTVLCDACNDKGTYG